MVPSLCTALKWIKLHFCTPLGIEVKPPWDGLPERQNCKAYNHHGGDGGVRFETVHTSNASKQQWHTNPCQQHEEFSSIYLSLYYPDPMLLNISVRMVTGEFDMAQPVALMKRSLTRTKRLRRRDTAYDLDSSYYFNQERTLYKFGRYTNVFMRLTSSSTKLTLNKTLKFGKSCLSNSSGQKWSRGSPAWLQTPPSSSSWLCPRPRSAARPSSARRWSCRWGRPGQAGRPADRQTAAEEDCWMDSAHLAKKQYFKRKVQGIQTTTIWLGYGQAIKSSCTLKALIWHQW